MSLAAGRCAICGQPVLREQRRFRPGVRVICDVDCKATAAALAAGAPLEVEPRECSSCGEYYLEDVSAVGRARHPGGAPVCPACRREGRWEALEDRPDLDFALGVWGSLAALLRLALARFWTPGLACPRCGEPARRAYEWSCRYPLAVGICEGVSGPHVHSVCRRCGYEAVRLAGEQKSPPPAAASRGPGLQGSGAITSSSARRSERRPLETMSLR